MKKNTTELKNVNVNAEVASEVAPIEPTTPNAEVVAEVAPIAEKLEENSKLEDMKLAILAELKARCKKMSIRDLIIFRQYEVENILDEQRVPSHTPKKALEICASAVDQISCGVITIGFNTETEQFSIINGGSRVTDFIGFYNGSVASKDFSYKLLPKANQRAFLDFKLSIDWLEGTAAELARDYKNLNDNTSLTGGQKAIVNLSGSSALSIVRQLHTHSLFSKTFSDRQIQKEEPNNVLFLLLANIKGCYASSISKVTSNLATTDMSDIDIDRIKYIFDIIENAEVELTKFKLVHLAHLLYIGDCWKSKSLHIQFDIEKDIDSNVIALASTVNYATAGTNSGEMNTKRIDEMAKKLYNALHAKAKEEPTEPSEPILDPTTL